jgi:Flp pilus assembly pilin Flp
MVVKRIASDDQRGQTMAEFAVVLGLITVAIVTTISFLSDAVLAMFQDALDIISKVT